MVNGGAFFVVPNTLHCMGGGASNEMKGNFMTKVAGTTMCDCGHVESEHSDFTRGYGVNRDGKKHCYACCAEKDKQEMREHGDIMLYLQEAVEKAHVWDKRLKKHILGDRPMLAESKLTNWPGSLEFKLYAITHGFHSAFGGVTTRVDVWFIFEGFVWHGVQRGEMNYLLIRINSRKNWQERKCC